MEVINIYKSIATFREKVSIVKKDSDNPYFKSKYADLPSVLEAIKIPLKESDLSLFHKIVFEDGVYRLVTSLQTIDGSEKIESIFPVFGNKPQEIGSSITYARRYNILALLDIPTDEDDDGNIANSSKELGKQKPWMNDENLEGLKKVIDKFSSSDEAIKNARERYAVSKAMEEKIKNLFK